MNHFAVAILWAIGLIAMFGCVAAMNERPVLSHLETHR